MKKTPVAFNRSFIREVNYFSGLLFTVVVALFSYFLWVTWVAEYTHKVSELSSNLQFGVDFCSGYFQRVGAVQKMFGHELMQEPGQISAEKAALMLNNYKAINHDQRRFILLSANGEVIADTDITKIALRPYYLSEIPANAALQVGVKTEETLEFDDTQTDTTEENLILPLRYVIRNPAGEVKYLLQSRLQIGILRSLWNITFIPQRSTVGFLHDSGQLVSRYSIHQSEGGVPAFGQSSAYALAKYLQSGNFPSHGTMETREADDALSNLVVFRRLANHPITLFMSIPLEDLRAEWWLRVKVPVVLALVLLAMGIAIHQLIVRQQKKEYRAMRKQMQLQDMAQGILDAQEEERARISHELHDEIGQSLTVLKITLNRSLQSLQDHTQARSILAGGQQIVDGMMREVREIAYRLRPIELDQLGLAAALRAYVDKTSHALPQKITLTENIGDRRFPAKLELCCFRVAQEALTNCLRHAMAARFRISIRYHEPRLTLMVTDNGVGFSVREYYSSKERLKSLGLLGMRERVSVSGGEFRIRSIRNRGTVIKVVFDIGMIGMDGEA